MLRRLLAASFALAACAQAATIRVPADQPTIQAGLDAAAEGDTVLVAPGTYTGVGNKDLDFGGIDRALISEEGAGVTVINCEEDGRGFHFHSGESVATIVAGFTVTGGDESGIRCYSSDPTVTNCTITGNTARWGGGIYINSSSPTLARCVIAGNVAEEDGGGVWMHNCYSPLTNCIIAGNVAERNGGGLACEWGQPTLTNCLFSDNVAAYYGGGLDLDQDEYSPLQLTNCTLSGNSAGYEGGGLFCYLSDPRVTNCIIWDNTPEEVYGFRGYPTITYCDVKGGYVGEGNIDADPSFRTKLGFDFVLWPRSRCIDSGTGEDDGIDWTQIHPVYGRHNTSAPDMGAYGGPGNVGWLP